MKNIFVLLITIVLNLACAAQTDSVKSARDYIIEQENKRNTPNTVKPKPKTLKPLETSDKQTKTKKKFCRFFCKKKRKASN